MNILKITSCLILILLHNVIYGQDKYDALNEKLTKLSTDIPALEEKVNISVTKVSIQEFLRGVANNTGLNIDVDPGLNITVINNFSNVKVRDLLVYLCKQYDLELNVIGNILNIYKVPQIDPIKSRLNAVKYDSIEDKISLDYSNETLVNVVKDITKYTKKNIILSPGLNETKVSGYIQSMPFGNALEKFMYGNNLLISKTDDNFFIVEAKQVETKENNKKGGDQKKTQQERKTNDGSSLEVKQVTKDSVRVFADGVSVSDLIYEVADKTHSNYYITGNIEDKVSLKLDKTSFTGVLDYVLNGTKYTYRSLDSIIIIGDDRSSLLKQNTVIHLKNRAIEKISDIIPKSLKENLEIIEFPDLNSLLVSGPQVCIKNLNDFVSQIDQKVPVILIEVVIVNFSKSLTLTTGIGAGLGKPAKETSQTIFPGIDYTFSSQAINKFLQKHNGFGLENLGNVAPDFYLTMSALENQGLVDVQSTPKLSTLNGHEATLSIGNTQYYLEEQSNFIGTQNPLTSTNKVYKSLNADLSITIKPFVAGDDQITLEIEVKQSDFEGAKISPTAPPPSVSRNFKSQIRVKSQDMVLLGGLDKNTKSDSGSGTPFLSRIPIIKWFFSSRSKENSKNQLNIFIRPTIVG
jgi:type IV pilus assembly protein PilQ